MAEAERAVVSSSSRSSGGSSAANERSERREHLRKGDAFERAKRQLLLACGAIGGGLAVAGSIDRTTGGVLLLVGWLLGVVALHRLGRTGSDRGEGPRS